MVRLGKTDRGQFCWLDLAATNADRAKTFYRKLFGWTSHEQQANGGSFTRLRLSDQDVGSIYQLREALLDHGMSSHWTPYVRVNDVTDKRRPASRPARWHCCCSSLPCFGRRAHSAHP